MNLELLIIMRLLLTISKETTYHINEDLWADAELYFYGTLVNAGGKDKTNIHLLTKDKGSLIIATEREFLQGLEENVLYKHFMVRAKGRQNILTGELDTSSLQLLQLSSYDPTYNEQYLDNLIKKHRLNGLMWKMLINGSLKLEESMAKKKEEAKYSVILDTSFMIRFLSKSDKLHDNALGYFRYFLEHDIPMYFSTISIAEYCVKGDFEDLPFQYIRVLPFNVFHAKEARSLCQRPF